MKLLIDIPEPIYEHAKEMSEDSRDEGEAMRAIANGSPARCKGVDEAEKERLIKKDIKSIENRVRSAFNQGYEMGVKELKAYKEQSGDAISRDKTIVQLSHLLSDWDDDWNVGIRKCIETVKSVKSVTPQQKMGKWKFTVYDANRIGHYECSECHWNVLMNVSDYCPHCGAKMESEDKE